MHFLTCTDEKRWKSGKRKAEKDPLGDICFLIVFIYKTNHENNTYYNKIIISTELPFPFCEIQFSILGL